MKSTFDEFIEELYLTESYKQDIIEAKNKDDARKKKEILEEIDKIKVFVAKEYSDNFPEPSKYMTIDKEKAKKIIEEKL